MPKKLFFFFHSLESSFDLQSKKKIGVGHQPNPPCKLKSLSWNCLEGIKNNLKTKFRNLIKTKQTQQISSLNLNEQNMTNCSLHLNQRDFTDSQWLLRKVLKISKTFHWVSVDFHCIKSWEKSHWKSMKFISLI